MNNATAVINIKTDVKIKRQAQKLAEQLGMSLSGVINASLRQFLNSKTLFVSTEYREPSEMLKKAIQEGREERKKGLTRKFENVDDAIKFVDDLIAKKRKK
ncbi:MAG: type II toxin-antitoxin system RelB/DinJ family antitoxin [Candidatus Magasanikbacteria bacterium]